MLLRQSKPIEVFKGAAGQFIDNVTQNVSHLTMQTITLRQLRDTKQVKEWLRAGVHIEVRERGEVIGDLVPRTPPSAPRPSPTLRPAAVASLATTCSLRTSSLRPARIAGIDCLR